MARFTLSFESEVRASPEESWTWVTSVAGIRAEMRPLARMTMPRGIESILDVDFELGTPLFRSWLLLFGILPIERSDLTLIELTEGRGLVEESPMLMMRLWRHERRIDPVDGGSRITDVLTFEPRVGGRLVERCVETFFRHRHRVLRRALGTRS